MELTSFAITPSGLDMGANERNGLDAKGLARLPLGAKAAEVRVDVKRILRILACNNDHIACLPGDFATS